MNINTNDYIHLMCISITSILSIVLMMKGWKAKRLKNKIFVGIQT